MNRFEQVLEKLTQEYTGKEYEAEVLDAKREFFERAGIMDEASQNFESRMAQFLDWYMFSRELSHVHMPPVVFHLEKNRSTIGPEEAPLFEALTKTVHSLFEFIKLRDQDIVVRDLFTKKKLELLNSSYTHGFNPEEVFEARLIPDAEHKTWIFTKGFCFHPLEASSFILKEIKQVRHLDQSHKEALMLKLMKMRYKHEQYRHIRLDYIYSNDPKLKI